VTGNGGGNWLFGHAGSPTERNLFFGNLFLDANDADATESFIFV